MSRKRFTGLLDTPPLFTEVPPPSPPVDPEALTAKPAEPCPRCRWLSLEDPCECCGHDRDHDRDHDHDHDHEGTP